MDDLPEPIVFGAEFGQLAMEIGAVVPGGRCRSTQVDDRGGRRLLGGEHHGVEIAARFGLTGLGGVFLDFLGGGAGREYLHVAAAVPVHRDAFTSEFERHPIDLLDLGLGGVIGEVDGFGNRTVIRFLEGGLHPDVPFSADVVGGDEDALPLFRDLRMTSMAGFGDPLEQVVGVPSFPLGNGDKIFVDIGHQDAGLIPHERHGEQRLDPGTAARNDRDGPGRRDRRHIAIPEPAHRPNPLAVRIAGTGGVGAPNAPLPFRKRAPHGREPFRLNLGLVVDETLDLAPEFDGFG